MRKLAPVVYLIVLCVGLPALLEQTFRNCTEVNRVYPWGVSRTLAAAKKQKNYPVNNPYVSADLYRSIQKMDRDKDQTACER